MLKLSNAKEAKIDAFLNRSGTGASRKSAQSVLEKWDWNVEIASKQYLKQNPNSTNLQYQPKADQSSMEQLYRRYKDPDEDMIMADGIGRLCTDLEVDPADIVMLVMSWHMKAATTCEFSRQEFFKGLKELKADTLEKLRSALPAMRAELKDKNKFQEMYNFAFGWAKEKGQKSMQLETAIEMWQLLFAEMTPKWTRVDQWYKFLEERHKLAITKDTWTQLLDFVREVDPSMSDLDEERCWPYLFDEFVEYVRVEEKREKEKNEGSGAN